MKAQPRGFVLIAALMVLLLAGAMLSILQSEMIAALEVSSNVEGQLHSLNLAENGIELGRSLLSAAEIDQLLVGENSFLDCSEGPEWRNPLSLDVVRTQGLELLTQNCDDGRFPMGWRAGHQGTDSGKVFLRFSNNPEEENGEDDDSVVILRSLGVVESRSRRWSKNPAANLFSLVEARLRQQRPFQSGAALTLVGPGAILNMAGGALVGGPGGAIAAVQWPVPGLLEAIRRQILPSDALMLQGPLPHLRDCTASCFENPSFVELMEACRDGRLEEHLKILTGCPRPEAECAPDVLCLDGGILRETRAGLVISRGNVEVDSTFRFSGLLVHLGEGRLTLHSGSSIRGGIWAFSEAGENLDLALEPGAQVSYEEESLHRADTLLRPTVVYWRILFPEMLL